MKSHYTFQNRNFYFLSAICLSGFLFFWLSLVQPLYGRSLTLDGDPPITRTTGGPGNPRPEFCDEPCDTQLRRWFTVDIGDDAGDGFTLNNFTLHNFHFHETMTDLQTLNNPTTTLTIESWSLVNTQGDFPNGIIGVHGAFIDGVFYDFPIVVPAGETATVFLEAFMIGCVSESNGLPAVMPRGYYSIDFELDIDETDIYQYEMKPVTSCGMNGASGVVSIQANPNPFLDNVKFDIELPEDGLCSLSIYNIQGQEVLKVMHNELLHAGSHDLNFNLSEFSNGIYIARLETPIGVKSMRLLKQ